MLNLHDDQPADSLQRGDRVFIVHRDAPDVEGVVIGFYVLPNQPVMVLIQLDTGETVDVPQAAVGLDA
jgi:hypothetical protein